MPRRFLDSRYYLNKAIRSVFTDESKNFVTLERELEALDEIDGDELNQNEIFQLENDYESWCQREAMASGRYKAQVRLHRLQHNEIDERGEEEMFLEEAIELVQTRPEVITFENTLARIRLRYHRTHLPSGNSSADYSYSSS